VTRVSTHLRNSI